ncbi:MAG: hypothetical protein ACQETP_09090 [Bacteroidota bacterium]
MPASSLWRCTLIAACATLVLFPGCMSGCDTDWVAKLTAPDPECVSTEENNPGYDQTIVFVDASGSANQDAILDHYEGELNWLIDERLDEGKYCKDGEIAGHPGDQLHLFPIHEKTISKEGRWDVENGAAPPEWSQFGGDLENNKTKFRSRLSRFETNTREEVPTRVSNIVTNSAFSGATDIWGSLQVIGDEVDPNASSVQVVYLSDMFEAVGGSGRRNFESRPPTTNEQAREWARRDVGENLNQHINLTEERTEALRQAEVRVLPGPLATKDSAPEVQVYWETLFQELGVQNVRYN